MREINLHLSCCSVMNLVRRLIIPVIFLFAGTQSFAQDEEEPDSTLLTIRPYGSLRGHFAIYNGEMEIQENGSRIGFELGVQRNKIRFFAGVELQINLFRGITNFNASTNTSGGFLVAERNQERQVFATRLGYLGLDLNKWGVITIGKQYSAYMDVTSYTDKFNVFGAQASATYVAGTDGGETGTGRADQVVTYRNSIGPLKFTGQLQFKNGGNDQFVDGAGISAQLKILKGLWIGASYNHMFLDKDLIDRKNFLGLDNQPNYFSAGLSFASKKLEISAVFAHQTNGDLANGFLRDTIQGPLSPTVVFDANGFELYARYNFKKFGLIGGFNYYKPDTDVKTPDGEMPLSPDFKKKYWILGMEYDPFQHIIIYSETRIASGKTAAGTEEFDVFTLGIKINVEKIFSKKLNR